MWTLAPQLTVLPSGPDPTSSVGSLRHTSANMLQICFSHMPVTEVIPATNAVTFRWIHLWGLPGHAMGTFNDSYSKYFMFLYKKKTDKAFNVFTRCVYNHIRACQVQTCGKDVALRVISWNWESKTSENKSSSMQLSEICTLDHFHLPVTSKPS